MLPKARQLAYDMKRRSFLVSALSLSVSSGFTFPLSNFSARIPPTRHFSRINNNNMSANAANGASSTCSTKLLPTTDASHNSAKVIITPDFDDADFEQRLESTIQHVRDKKKTSLWIDVDISRASLMESMSKFGLKFHHAQDSTATLNLWLNDETTNKVPPFATHHVGVGALVVNSRNQVLVVRELRNNLRPWKLPGGLSDLGEDIPEAACREVLEETGITCKFLNILSFRHTHGMAHDRSDLYFVCRLQPIEQVDKEGNAIIPTPVPCEEEIAATAWISMDEYRDMINAKDGHPMMQHVMKLYDEDCEIQQTVVNSIVPGRKPSPIYHAPMRQGERTSR